MAILTTLDHLSHGFYSSLLSTLKPSLCQQWTDHHLEGPSASQIVIVCRGCWMFATWPLPSQNPKQQTETTGYINKELAEVAKRCIDTAKQDPKCSFFSTFAPWFRMYSILMIIVLFTHTRLTAEDGRAIQKRLLSPLQPCSSIMKEHCTSLTWKIQNYTQEIMGRDLEILANIPPPGLHKLSDFSALYQPLERFPHSTSLETYSVLTRLVS